MRISDWSSDVCSSDLVHRRLLAVIGAIFEPHITFRRKLRSLADAGDDAAVRRLSIEHGRWSSQHLDTVQGIHCCPRKGRVAVEIAQAVKKLHRREPTNDRSIIARVEPVGFPDHACGVSHRFLQVARSAIAKDRIIDDADGLGRFDKMRVDLGRCNGPSCRDSDVFGRSEEHTSELQSLMRNSYAVFCLKKKKTNEDKI